MKVGALSETAKQPAESRLADNLSDSVDGAESICALVIVSVGFFRTFHIHRETRLT